MRIRNYLVSAVAAGALGLVGLMSGCSGGMMMIGATPAVEVGPNEHKTHYCPPESPKADYRRVTVGRETPGIRVWCYAGTDATNSSTAVENLDASLNYAMYYLCKDASDNIAAASAQLNGDPYIGYYVDCQ